MEIKNELCTFKQEKADIHNATETTRKDTLDQSLLPNERTVLLSDSSEAQSDESILSESDTDNDDDVFQDTRDIIDIDEPTTEQPGESSDNENTINLNISEDVAQQINDEWLIGETNYCSDSDHDSPQSNDPCCCMSKIYKEFPDKDWTPCKTPSNGYDEVYQQNEFIHDSEQKLLNKINCCDYHHHANLILSFKQWRRDKKHYKLKTQKPASS